jgi:hypothetical protein
MYELGKVKIKKIVQRWRGVVGRLLEREKSVKQWSYFYFYMIPSNLTAITIERLKYECNRALLKNP